MVNLWSLGVFSPLLPIFAYIEIFIMRRPNDIKAPLCQWQKGNDTYGQHLDVSVLSDIPIALMSRTRISM